MPKCVVKGCKNQSASVNKQDGITFHKFPNRDKKINEKWIKVIRDSRKEPSWQPTGSSVICSAHFKNDDLYYTEKGLRRVLKNGYPKILLNINEESDNADLSQAVVVKEEPATSNLSNDANSGQPSSCALKELAIILQNITEGSDDADPLNVQEPAISNLSNDANLGQPSSSCAREEPATPNLSNDANLGQPSSSCAVQAVQSDSPIWDTPRKHKLRQRVLRLEKNKTKFVKKIKTLNQKLRRLHKRNKSLKEIVSNLTNENNIDTDLFNQLNGNIAAVDMLKALKRKNLKKKIEYTPAIKKFCLTLNYYSPKAYEFVRATFNTCLPHHKTLAKWQGNTKGEPGFTEESVGTASTATGFPEESVGTTSITTGFPEESAGTTSIATGFTEKSVGSTSTTTGFTEESESE